MLPSKDKLQEFVDAIDEINQNHKAYYKLREARIFLLDVMRHYDDVQAFMRVIKLIVKDQTRQIARESAKDVVERECEWS